MNFRTMDEQARRNGVSNVDHDEPFSPESRYLGCPIPDASEALCAAADPASYAGPRMCPIYVQHGTRDRLVPYEQSVEFVRALRERGVGERVSFQPLEGADHEDKAFFTDENLNHVRAFLEAVLGRETNDEAYTGPAPCVLSAAEPCRLRQRSGAAKRRDHAGAYAFGSGPARGQLQLL